MAKREQVNGRNYTFFIDYDRAQLSMYQEDWMEWFRQRVLFILIDPIEEILKNENVKKFDNENFTLYIGILTLICCGIEAMGGFYKGQTNGKNFKHFAEDYMDPIYKEDKNKLEILHDYFRCGLAHGFCIKQGGMYWGAEYFVEDKEFGLQLSIRKLFKDFKQAFLKYIDGLKKANKNSSIYKNFHKRFNCVFILGR